MAQGMSSINIGLVVGQDTYHTITDAPEVADEDILETAARDGSMD